MLNSNIIAIRRNNEFYIQGLHHQSSLQAKNNFLSIQKLRISCETRAKIRKKALTVGSLAIKLNEKNSTENYYANKNLTIFTIIFEYFFFLFLHLRSFYVWRL
jgi:hypothetical protein